MREQFVEAGGERRASLPELFVTLAQPLIRRQTRQPKTPSEVIEEREQRMSELSSSMHGWRCRQEVPSLVQ